MCGFKLRLQFTFFTEITATPRRRSKRRQQGESSDVRTANPKQRMSKPRCRRRRVDPAVVKTTLWMLCALSLSLLAAVPGVSGDSTDVPTPTASATITSSTSAQEPTSAPIDIVVDEASEGNGNDGVSRLGVVGIALGGAAVVGACALFWMRKQKQARTEPCTHSVADCDCDRKGDIGAHHNSGTSHDCESGKACGKRSSQGPEAVIGVGAREEGHLNDHQAPTSSTRATNTDGASGVNSDFGALESNGREQSVEDLLHSHVSREVSDSQWYSAGSSQHLTSATKSICTCLGSNKSADECATPKRPPCAVIKLAEQTESNTPMADDDSTPMYATPAKLSRTRSKIETDEEELDRWPTPVREFYGKGVQDGTVTPPSENATPAKGPQHVAPPVPSVKSVEQLTDRAKTDGPSIPGAVSMNVTGSESTSGLMETSGPTLNTTSKKKTRGAPRPAKRWASPAREATTEGGVQAGFATPIKGSREGLEAAEVAGSLRMYETPDGQVRWCATPTHATEPQVVEDAFVLHAVEAQMSADLNESLVSCDWMEPQTEETSPVVPTMERLSRSPEARIVRVEHYRTPRADGNLRRFGTPARRLRESEKSKQTSEVAHVAKRDRPRSPSLQRFGTWKEVGTKGPTPSDESIVATGIPPPSVPLPGRATQAGVRQATDGAGDPPPLYMTPRTLRRALTAVSKTNKRYHLKSHKSFGDAIIRQPQEGTERDIPPPPYLTPARRRRVRAAAAIAPKTEAREKAADDDEPPPRYATPDRRARSRTASA